MAKHMPREMINALVLTRVAVHTEHQAIIDKKDHKLPNEELGSVSGFWGHIRDEVTKNVSVDVRNGNEKFLEVEKLKAKWREVEACVKVSGFAAARHRPMTRAPARRPRNTIIRPVDQVLPRPSGTGS